MATESIFHNVVLREPEEIEAFVAAIEKSREMAKKHPFVHTGSKTASKTRVKEMFKDKKSWLGLND